MNMEKAAKLLNTEPAIHCRQDGLLPVNNNGNVQRTRIHFQPVWLKERGPRPPL